MKNNKKKSEKEEEEKTKKKKKEIERERERKKVTKRSERRQGERKGDTEKWTKITLFQGENSVFVKRPQKNQKIRRSKPTAQKHTCNAALPPIPRRMRTNEKTPKQKEGGVKRTTWSLRKRGRQKKTEKDAKTLRTAAARPFLPTTPNPTEKLTHPRAHRASNLRARARPTQRKKKRFWKRPRLCSPNAFLNLKTQFRQKIELLKVENSDTQKKFSSKTVRRIEAF